MTASKELLLAYDDAMAVMSKPCRFVEWKIYGGGAKVETWSPFGVSPDKKGAWKEIEGERWIYVFRSYARTRSAGVWIEELHLDKHGEIAATPMDKAIDAKSGGPLERDKRPEPLAIGKTMSFARRVHGVAMEYYYFASRIRLPAKTITAIGPNIAAYAPPINFEEDDRNIVGEKDGARLVPVLDPITIAIHLHACYVAAANDLIDYTTDHEGQSSAKRKQVAKRQKKHLLAELVQALVDPKVDTNNQLVHRLDVHKVDGNYRLEYLNGYDQQIAHRLQWRDRWAGFLSRWLASDTMKILAEAHSHEAKQDFHKLLIPFCMCVTRLGESPAGRNLLDGLYANGDHWVHSYVLPILEPSPDHFQVIRKGGGAVFEALKEWGPRIILEPAKYGKINFTQTFNWLAGEKIIAPASASIKVADEVVVYSVAHGPRVVQITEVKVLLKDAEIAPKWEGAAKKLGVILEAINTVIAIKQVIDKIQDGTGLEKTLAILNLVGSALDMTTAILQFTKAGSRTLGAIGFVSGIIDTVLAIADAVEAFKKDDMGGMVGSSVIAVGSALAAGSGLALLAGSSAAGPLGIAALVVVALGYSIKLIFGDNDTPYHKLITYCEWGIKAGQGSDQPDWAPAPYKSWKGDYDLQLKAAINVLCGVTIERNDIWEPREARVTVGWVPPGATLLFVYREEWAFDGVDQTWSDSFLFDAKGPSATTHLLTINARDKTSYVVRPPKTANEPTVLMLGKGNSPFPVKSLGLTKISIEAQLSFELLSTKYLIPNDKKIQATLLS